MAFIFHLIVSPLARTWKVRSRERSLSYDLQTVRRGRMRAESQGLIPPPPHEEPAPAAVVAAAAPAPAPEAKPLPSAIPVMEPMALEPTSFETAMIESLPMELEEEEEEQPPVAAAPAQDLPAEDAPPTMTEADLVSLAQACDLEELLRSPLGKAIQRYLALRYPHLQEYEDLILAEAGDLLHTDLGRQLVVMDPGEFVEATVRRAVITIAEIRVGLRQAVRSRLAGDRAPATPPPSKSEEASRISAH